MVVSVFAIIGVVLAGWALTLSVVDHFRLRKQVIEQQNRAELLASRLRHHERVTAEVAHELKNPITAVVCAAETLELLLDDRIDDSHRDTLRYIRDYGEHVLTIMGDFIDISRGISGEYTSTKEDVSVLSVVESVQGLLAPTAGKRGVTLHYSADEASYVVHVDPKHLKQIIFNLVHNGVKFASFGGNVWIHVSRSSDQDHLIITVRDDGPGMPQAVVDEVVRSNKISVEYLSREGAGSGLGLILTRELIEVEGGVWDIVAEPGKGTAIAVSFAGGLQRPSLAPLGIVPTGQEVSMEVERPFSGHSVLVVDDDCGSREAVRKLIEALGGIVDGVSEASQAVEALKARSYDAVLIDEKLIIGSSSEISEAMGRGQGMPSHGKLIIASSERLTSESESTTIGGDIYVDSVIEKPLSKKALVTSLLPSH